MKAIRYLLLTLFLLGWLYGTDEPSQPDILFIAVDDLNDWIEPLGGHPQAITPNFERLAKMGTIFPHAYCAAPACNPSRVAVLSGMAPHRSGIYINNQPMWNSPAIQEAVMLPSTFRRAGYRAIGSGKIYHSNFPDAQSWDDFWPSLDLQRPWTALPPPADLPLNGIPQTSQFDWGIVDARKEDLADWKVADWVIHQLEHPPEDQPMFLACGIYLPHLPWYVPEAYFEPFPIESIQLPEVLNSDLEDLPVAARSFIRLNDHDNVLAHDQWKYAVQGYLASISYADMILGRLLDALEQSPRGHNTIVVLWSDHGWNLGEKQHWRKFALWENTTRSVLMWAGPGIPPGEVSEAPASLLDIYPTLVRMAGIEETPDLLRQMDGTPLTFWFENPARERGKPVLTTWHKENHSLRSKRWRYTRYADGSEELYDHQNDPNEWVNLAGKPEFQSVIRQHAKFLPQHNADQTPADGEEPSYYERLELQFPELKDIIREYQSVD